MCVWVCVCGWVGLWVSEWVNGGLNFHPWFWKASRVRLVWQSVLILAPATFVLAFNPNTEHMTRVMKMVMHKRSDEVLVYVWVRLFSMQCEIVERLDRRWTRWNDRSNNQPTNYQSDGHLWKLDAFTTCLMETVLTDSHLPNTHVKLVFWERQTLGVEDERNIYVYLLQV